jgi:hypothetical protein
MDKLLDDNTAKELTPESLVKIEEALAKKVNDKVTLHVEKALTEQDQLYSDKLTELLVAIDKDHVGKLKRVVEAIDTDRANKLKLVIKKYETSLNEDAKKFKAQLIESVSTYLDEFLKELVPAAEIKEAVRNKKALKVLESLRTHLAVDAALQKSSVKDAIIDGKKQISEASTKLESVVQENTALHSELNSLKANLLIEQKTASLSEQQKKYIKKVLTGKTPDFITENFDYTLKLFKKNENARLETLKEEAQSDNTSKADRVVLEQTNEIKQEANPYLAELGKY